MFSRQGMRVWVEYKPERDEERWQVSADDHHLSDGRKSDRIHLLRLI